MESLIGLLTRKFEEETPTEGRTYEKFSEFAQQWLSKNRPVAVSSAALRNLAVMLSDRTTVTLAPEITAETRAKTKVPNQPQPVSFSGSSPEPNLSSVPTTKF